MFLSKTSQIPPEIVSHAPKTTPKNSLNNSPNRLFIEWGVPRIIFVSLTPTFLLFFFILACFDKKKKKLVSRSQEGSLGDTENPNLRSKMTVERPQRRNNFKNLKFNYSELCFKLVLFFGGTSILGGGRERELVIGSCVRSPATLHPEGREGLTPYHPQDHKNHYQDHQGHPGTCY